MEGTLHGAMYMSRAYSTDKLSESKLLTFINMVYSVLNAYVKRLSNADERPESKRIVKIFD